MFTARTLAEGKWPILTLGALSVATLLWCPVAWAPVLPVALLVFVISFFRDPDAKVPADEKLIVAPATGKIVEIKPVGATTMVAIFLSVFDVHVQRAPARGVERLEIAQRLRMLQRREREWLTGNRHILPRRRRDQDEDAGVRSALVQLSGRMEIARAIA